MPPTVLSSSEAHARLSAAGIAVPATAEAPDAASAADVAASLGASTFVLKAGGLLHKSDEGGVVLGLTSPDEVRVAAHGLVDRLGPRCLPLVLQEQCEGLEILVGVRRVPRLGTALMVGAGGIYTEILHDVGQALVPVDADGARAMLDRLRIRPLLDGARGGRPRDLEALVRLVTAVSGLAEAHDDLVELDLNPVLVGPVGDGVVAVDARMIVDPTTPRPPVVGPPRDLDRLMRPRHVAVVGVSDDPAKVGARLFAHLVRHGFDGRLDPVHPAGGTVQGHPRATSLRELDAAPDLVCVAVPARQVLDVARQAAAVGAGALLVHSSDFAEMGAAGRRLQDDLVTITDEAGIALAGPNDMGIVAPGQRLAASISGALSKTRLVAGSTALVSSSGALGSCLATRLMEEGLGLSHWIHAGNEADLTVADYLRWLVDDPSTAAVGLLLEDIKDGPAFTAATRQLVAAGKPVFAYHMVRSSKGQSAAQSHTGAMVGPFELRETVLHAGGVASVPTLQVLEDALRLAAVTRLPAGRRLVALTFSGGACTIIADAAEELGIDLPDLDDATRAAVAEHLPSFAAVRNPLDVSFQLIADPDRFRDALRALLAGQRYDAALVQFTTNADPGAARTAEAVLRVMDEVDVPVYVGRYGGAGLAPEALAIYAQAGVPVLDAPDRSMRAVAALVAAGAHRDRLAAATRTTTPTR